MQNLIPLPVYKKNLPYIDVAPGVIGLQILFVNVYFVQIEEQSSKWFLVDTGVGKSAGRIKKAAAEIFGTESRPEAIILTHGHFDHVGGVTDLAKEWDVPVYAHMLELPYLTGRSAYPPPDPSVGGGAFSYFSKLYPNKPIDISGRVNALPSDGTLPGIANWIAIHTPGHSPGHVSLFRDSDGVLLAGDAFTTVKQESLSAVLMQRKEINGPPAFLTTDWNAAKRSVQALAKLKPEVAACGHGQPMYEHDLEVALNTLSLNFELIAVPEQGRYVEQPAITDETGVVELPPPVEDPLTRNLIIATAALAGAAITYKLLKKK